MALTEVGLQLLFQDGPLRAPPVRDRACRRGRADRTAPKTAAVAAGGARDGGREDPDGAPEAAGGDGSGFDLASFRDLMWDDASTTLGDRRRWVGKRISTPLLQRGDGGTRSDDGGTKPDDRAGAAGGEGEGATPTPLEVLAGIDGDGAPTSRRRTSLGGRTAARPEPREVWGLTQEHGGPCGVLAALQAEAIRVLLFGSGGGEEGPPLPLRAALRLELRRVRGGARDGRGGRRGDRHGARDAPGPGGDVAPSLPEGRRGGGPGSEAAVPASGWCFRTVAATRRTVRGRERQAKSRRQRRHGWRPCSTASRPGRERAVPPA